MTIHRSIFLSFFTAMSLAATSSAGFVTEFSNDQAGWSAAVNGRYTTLDFTGFPPGDSPIFDQYTALGVLFPDGSDFVATGAPGSLFPLDGCGIFGGDPSGVITMAFTVPQQWIAAHHPGNIAFRLFSGGALLYESSLMSGESSDFSGVVSLLPFDSVRSANPSPASPSGAVSPAPPVAAS